MHVVKRKTLIEFAKNHPTAKGPLDAWYAEAKAAKWKNYEEVKAKYGSADMVAGNRVIFNIGGNKFRLVVRIQFKVGCAYIKFVGTHSEYDKIDARKVELR